MGKLLLGLCLGLCCTPAFAQQQWSLRIETPGSHASPPKVIESGAELSNVQFDAGAGRWIVPIRGTGAGFVTSYVVSLPNKNVVAVQLGVPTRLLEANQSVLISPRTIDTVDEAGVRKLWAANSITTQPSDARIQFRYLQDLVFINQELMSRPGAAAHRPNAVRMRAGFMLLQVVRNLAQNTWFVVDPSFQDVIDFVVEDLRQGVAAGKCKPWLGDAVCAANGVPALLETVRGITANRDQRMYAVLFPAGSKIDRDTCGGSQIQDLRDFYDFLHSSSEQGTETNRLNGTRVLKDLAACYSVQGLCGNPDPATATATLEAGVAFLEQNGSRATASELQALHNALAGLRAGQPAVCPVGR